MNPETLKSLSGVVIVAIALGGSIQHAVAQRALTSNAGESAQLQRETWLRPRQMTGAGEIVPGGIAGVPALQFLSTNSDPDGDAPDDVAYTPDGNQVIVVHRDTDNISFLDVNTRTVTHTVAVGDFPTDIAVTPNGQYAITPNVFGNSISIVSIATHSLVANVPITGLQPYRVAITPDSQFAIVGVINDAISSSFSVVNLSTQSETFSFPSTPQGVIGAFFTPESGISGPLLTQFALAPDGDTIVCPNRGGSQVILYSRTTGAAIATLPTAAGPTSVHISNDGTLAVVGHDSPGNAITKIDLVAHSVTGSLPTPVLDGQVIRITPDKSHAIAGISNNVIFVNLTTGAVAATIMTGVVGDIEISNNGQYAFVTNFNARVIDIPTRTLVATIPFAACVEAACSPTQLRAVALNSRFREDIQFYSINGAASSFEGFALTGAVPEGDAARNLALSADGNTLVVCHNTSRNVGIVDVPSRSVQAYVDVGERPLAAAITPNNQYAVVCATDANAVKIIDLNTNAVVSTLSIFNRPSQIRISPDSQWAYVLNIAGGDKVSFIQLNGAASLIVSQLSAGDAGSALGYSYTEISGIELSPSGAVLAVCDSFANTSPGGPDNVRLFDAINRTQLAAVQVADFPIRVAFNPAGTRVYAANAFGDSVSVINVNGAASSVIATIPGIEFPLTVDVDSTGSYVYVGNTDSNNPRIFVIDAATNTIVGSVLLSAPARDSHYSAADNILYAAQTDGQIARINAAGPASAVIDTTALSSGPSDMEFSDGQKLAFLAQPIPDGVDIVDFAPAPKCIADISGDSTVNVADLLAVINGWGPCPIPPQSCPADIAPPGGDGVVNVADLLNVINNWGPCP